MPLRKLLKEGLGWKRRAIRKTVKKTKYVAEGVKEDISIGVEVIKEDVAALHKKTVKRIMRRK